MTFKDIRQTIPSSGFLLFFGIHFKSLVFLFLENLHFTQVMSWRELQQKKYDRKKKNGLKEGQIIEYMWYIISYVKLKVMVHLLCLFAWRRYRYMDQNTKEVKLVMDKLDLPTLLNNWDILIFLIFVFLFWVFYSEVWKVMEAGSRVWELTAYSSWITLAS